MELFCKLTGVTYSNEGLNTQNRQLIIFQLKNSGLLDVGQELIFQWDKYNRFDSKAIAVFGPDMRQIGYLPKDMAVAVFEFSKLFCVRMYVDEITGGYSGRYFGVNIKIVLSPAPIEPPSLTHILSQKDDIDYNFIEQQSALNWNPHDLDPEDYENWLDDLYD